MKTLVHVADGLGLGGIEKTVLNHVLATDRRTFEVRVVAQEDGPRRSELEAASVRVDVAGGDGERLAELLSGADVVHAHRWGGHEPLVPAACRRAQVPVLVETNVFGERDPSPDERQFACHLFVSKMTAWRYRRRVGLTGPDFHARHRVSYNPIDVEGLRSHALPPREAKRRLGLDPDRPVVARTGRADDRKWRTLLVDMIPELLERCPSAQVLLVGTTPATRRRLRRLGLLERVHLLDLVPEQDLPLVYAASDVFVNASETGEAFGMVLAEAMALGVPVVTCSTPWTDNGGIEVVDHGRTGLVADHPQPFAEAVAYLLGDAQLRRAFGQAGREKVERLFEARVVTRQLERLYLSLLAGGAPPREWVPSLTELDDYDSEYRSRLAAKFRPLSPRERREARAGRARERISWTRRALLSTDRAMLRKAWSAARARFSPGRRARARRARHQDRDVGPVRRQS